MNKKLNILIMIFAYSIFILLIEIGVEHIIEVILIIIYWYEHHQPFSFNPIFSYVFYIFIIRGW
jgi:hypothetical protein